MKPLQIAVLVVAGAVTGALVMKIRQRSEAEVTPAIAQAMPPPQAAAAPQPVEPAPSGTSGTEPSVLRAEAAREQVANREVRVAPHRAKERPIRRVASYSPEMVYRVPVTHVPLTANQEPASPATPLAAAGSEVPGTSQAPVSSRQSPAPFFIPPARTEPQQATSAPPLLPESHKVTLNAGLLIPVRLVDGLSAERNRPGDLFSATLDKELVVDEFVIAERGARVEGRVVASDVGGKTKGLSALSVELTRLNTSDGQSVAIRTESFERRASPSTGEDAGKIAAGAVLGAIVGAAAAGGKGAAAGAGIGGAAGTAGVLLTRGKPVSLPSETRITFRLDKSVKLTERTQ